MWRLGFRFRLSRVWRGGLPRDYGLAHVVLLRAQGRPETVTWAIVFLTIVLILLPGATLELLIRRS